MNMQFTKSSPALSRRLPEPAKYSFSINEEIALIVDCDGREEKATIVKRALFVLGFPSVLVSHVSADKLLSAVEHFAKCSKNIFVCIILAAGSITHIRATDGFVPRSTIIQAANVPSLRDKPKFLLFDGQLIDHITRAPITWTPKEEAAIYDPESTIVCNAFAFSSTKEHLFLREFLDISPGRKVLEISDLIRLAQAKSLKTHTVHVAYKSVCKRLFLFSGVTKKAPSTSKSQIA